MTRKTTHRAKPAALSPDQRRDVRVALRARVDFELTSHDSFLFEYTSNVSRGGIFLSTSNPLPIGTMLTLRFDLGDEGGRTVRTAGRVIWVNHFQPGGRNLNPGMGIEFVDLSDEHKEAISRLVRRKAMLTED